MRTLILILILILVLVIFLAGRAAACWAKAGSRKYLAILRERENEARIHAEE